MADITAPGFDRPTLLKSTKFGVICLYAVYTKNAGPSARKNAVTRDPGALALQNKYHLNGSSMLCTIEVKPANHFHAKYDLNPLLNDCKTRMNTSNA